MTSYLTLAEFKGESTMSNAAIDELESIAPGYIDRKIASVSASVDARLAKRYAVPFASPFPLAVVRWVSDIVTREAYLKRGVDSNDVAWATAIEPAATRAETELAEAAKSDTGLFDLPLRADTSATGISKGGPMMISSASPYAWRDDQKRRVVAEAGTGGVGRRG